MKRHGCKKLYNIGHRKRPLESGDKESGDKEGLSSKKEKRRKKEEKEKKRKKEKHKKESDASDEESKREKKKKKKKKKEEKKKRSAEEREERNTRKSKNIIKPFSLSSLVLRTNKLDRLYLAIYLWRSHGQTLVNRTKPRVNPIQLFGVYSLLKS
jgi:hypothetical protein